MKVAIATHGRVNSLLMERLVQCHPFMRGKDVCFFSSDYPTGTTSSAYTALAVRRMPAVAVMNTDSVPETPYIQRWQAEGALTEVAPSCEWRIVLFEPNVESWLLRQPVVGRELVPAPLTPEQLERARTEPRQVLAEVYRAGEKEATQALLRRLAEVDVSPLWATEELRPVESFLIEKIQYEPPKVEVPPLL